MLDDKRKKEKEIVEMMIRLYCKKNHYQKEMCSSCESLKEYAFERIDRCPMMANKTFCSSCKVHCYSKQRQIEIKKVMKFAGPRMIFYHPILCVRHIIDTIKNKKAVR